MKKGLCFLFVCLFLCGCQSGQKEADNVLRLRQRVENADKTSFTCTVTADYGDSLYSFSLACSFDTTGEMEFSVVSPQSIAGISGTVGQQGGTLTFDDQALAFPLLADGYLSPISAPWVFLKALRSGYIASCSTLESGLQFTLDDSYGESYLQIDVWTDGETVPTHCEMLWKGKRILSLDVENFSTV